MEGYSLEKFKVAPEKPPYTPEEEEFVELLDHVQRTMGMHEDDLLSLFSEQGRRFKSYIGPTRDFYFDRAKYLLEVAGARDEKLRRFVSKNLFGMDGGYDPKIMDGIRQKRQILTKGDHLMLAHDEARRMNYDMDEQKKKDGGSPRKS